MMAIEGNDRRSPIKIITRFHDRPLRSSTPLLMSKRDSASLQSRLLRLRAPRFCGHLDPTIPLHLYLCFTHGIPCS
jgi:hypothetical protein